MLNKFLYTHIDNSALIVFRIFFGLLIFLEAIGAILTGWVKRTLVEPEFTFTFIGFEWLTPIQQSLREIIFYLPSIFWEHSIPIYGMYLYFMLMGVFGFFVMIGYKYKWSIAGFTILWTTVYLMQKSSYNNHYYLLVLLCLFMLIVPAHRYASVDVKKKPTLKSISMPRWCSWIFILQMFIVYTYASIAKLYPDWISGGVTKNLMLGKKSYPIVGELLQQEWMHCFLAYAGIAFDLLVIPLLLWKRTRIFIFACAIFFHLFNSFVLHIGIFPYMSLALCLFFFEAKTVRNIFLRKKPLYTGNEIKIPPYRNVMIAVFSIYFIVQIALPLRHWGFQDDVLWTEEGHKLSWRMMLRSRSGYVHFKVVDKETKKVTIESPKRHVTAKQARRVAANPDMIWQFAQYLKKKYAKEGKDVAVYAEGKIQINRGKTKRLIDHTVDLANEPWLHTRHHDWILPSSKDEKKP